MGRVLIVDDDRVALKAIRDMLTAAGHECVCETSGAGALKVVEERLFDIIVLDIMLPDLSGFEVCRRLRRDTNHYTIPILVLSAMADEEEVMHILSQGADDFLGKKTELNKVPHRVAALLQSSSARATTDQLTGLPGPGATRLEAQRRITRHESFALIYLEMLDIRKFARHAGEQAREKAIRHLARTFGLCGEHLEGERFFAGHMGGGHFVCMVSVESGEDFCKSIRSRWLEHLPSLFAAVGLGKGGGDEENGNMPPSYLDLQICLTTFDGKSSITPRQMFDVLTRIRNKVIKTEGGGIYADNRS